MDITIGNIYMTDEIFIKVNSVENDTVFGFDIASEKISYAKKTDLKEIPKPVITILGNERARAVIAKTISDNGILAAKMLNCAEKTLYRMLKK